MFFFFSSRRRHTRWTGDWSSDVCSSDLIFSSAHRSKTISPDQGWYSPQINLPSVDFPLPETPTSATRDPAGIVSDKLSRSGGSRMEYPKLMLRSSTLPASLGGKSSLVALSGGADRRGYL